MFSICFLSASRSIAESTLGSMTPAAGARVRRRPAPPVRPSGLRQTHACAARTATHHTTRSHGRVRAHYVTGRAERPCRDIDYCRRKPKTRARRAHRCRCRGVGGTRAPAPAGPAAARALATPPPRARRQRKNENGKKRFFTLIAVRRRRLARVHHCSYNNNNSCAVFFGVFYSLCPRFSYGRIRIRKVRAAAVAPHGIYP